MAIICTDAKHDFNVELPGGCLHCRPIPAADDVEADRVLYTQARAVEILAQARAAQRPGADIMRELGPTWVGGAIATLEGLLYDAGVRL